MEEENPWKLGGSDFFMQKKEEYNETGAGAGAKRGRAIHHQIPMVGCVVVKDGRIYQ